MVNKTLRDTKSLALKRIIPLKIYMFGTLRAFFATESASSLLLAAMTIAAMLAANSPLAGVYHLLHGHGAEVFINDCLMSFFFLVIGIELKHEVCDGELSSWGQAALPLAGALGGVVLPALIYTGFNHGDAAHMRGWGVPMATDIAFALGLVGVFGSRLPVGLRVFLMALAVIDDLMAILVIAIFYTSGLNVQALCMVAFLTVVLLAYMRWAQSLAPFLVIGAGLWVAMLLSGVHATLAGVLLGLALPVGLGEKVLEKLHGPVAFCVVPVFVFANAGLALGDIGVEAARHPVTLGIGIGLFAGKQLGIFAASALLIGMGLARLPTGASWRQFYAVCMVAGIGFTMSLFIGTLAFGGSDIMTEVRLGVIAGSLASAVGGGILLALTLPAKGCHHE